LFEAMAEDKLIQPTILYDFPTDISPLSKQKREDPSLTERFEIYVAGMEVANGFSELNDPEEQERRFLAQIAQGGEEMPKQLDVDYIRALCHGMPPTAGEGIGIDRLTMLLTIRLRFETSSYFLCCGRKEAEKQLPLPKRTARNVSFQQQCD